MSNYMNIKVTEPFNTTVQLSLNINMGIPEIGIHIPYTDEDGYVERNFEDSKRLTACVNDKGGVSRVVDLLLHPEYRRSIDVLLDDVNRLRSTVTSLEVTHKSVIRKEGK